MSKLTGRPTFIVTEMQAQILLSEAEAEAASAMLHPWTQASGLPMPHTHWDWQCLAVTRLEAGQWAPQLPSPVAACGTEDRSSCLPVLRAERQLGQ